MTLGKPATMVVALSIALIFSQQNAIAQDGTDQDQLKIEITELEKAVQLLEDPEETKKVAAQLRVVLNAKKELLEKNKEVKKSKKAPSNFFKVYESYKRSIATALEKLASEIKIIILLVLAAVVWLFWKFLFKKLSKISTPIKEKYPEPGKQVDRYINFVGKGGYILILLFTFLTILDIWGFHIYEFIASSAEPLQTVVRIPLIVIGAVIIFELAKFLVNKLEKEATHRMLAARKTPAIEAEKRATTLGRIFKKVIGITIIAVTAMMIFAEVGFDIKPILAGAGIIGLAVGFGAQNLVRDIISGLFLIVENRIRVNDVAIINGTGGLVEQVNLRTTILRGLDGVVHVFPNGAINTLSNMTHEFSFYIFDVGVAYKEDVDRVITVLRELGEEMMRDEEYAPLILEPLEILGVDKFADSAVVIKARFKTLPIKQWLVGREMNRRIKNRFDELGIEIPFPHRTFYFGEASKPVSFKQEGIKEDREALKQALREGT